MDLNSARRAVDEAFFADETDAVRDRLARHGLDAAARARISARAAGLVRTIRADPDPNLLESFLAEYGLSTDEGVALMCLAEAYLRVPDAPTLDALIRDKIGGADWSKHSGETDSLLVNASTWALMLTGRIYGGGEEGGRPEQQVAGTLRRLVQRLGEPVVRTAVGQAMKAMGQQFVLGRSIGEALKRGQPMREKGYAYSYDMLGEAARTDRDARRYFRAYADAISAISKAADARAPAQANPGISVKLSALHPRYEYVQRARVMAELVPRLSALIEMARNANIGFNVDAEEADRLSLSLEVIEAALDNADLKGWDGFGIVVQSYSKQAMAVLDWVVALARTHDRRIAVRLVKGAYWDMEVKNAQVQGMPCYPTWTRKTSTDVSYLACTRKLFDHADKLYPQFATHNAHTAAAILEMAGKDAAPDLFEFQRLHGMGEALHDLLMAETGRRCRIYAPVGVHEDLLAYLVRRLLENGANSSFVNQLLDEDVDPEDLTRDPVGETERLNSIPHPHIPLPPDLYGPERCNAKGWNLNQPLMAEALDRDMAAFRAHAWEAFPLIAGEAVETAPQPVRNPANLEEVVGTVHEADAELAARAVEATAAAFPAWRDRPAEERAAILDRIAGLYEDHAPELIALATREAGKTRLDGVLEVREAVDFCRYYAMRARQTMARGERTGRGVFVCISPWNFPLAIYTGQIAAALVSGNAVVAKPAEQTPLIAARAAQLMYAAGVPREVLAFLPGQGAEVGAALTADPRIAGVCFTGSTETAVRIDRAMAASAHPRVPLIAETGGLNAMIVDSTALPEAAVRDIVNGAFQSAGQRCSACRALFVQKDIADKLLEMLEGATQELGVGDPWSPATDVGPVIDEEARSTIEDHVKAFGGKGRLLFRHRMEGAPRQGRFVAPAAIRLDRFEELEREIFGPVLHVLEFEAGDLPGVIDAINARGYGLTFGIHSRLDDRVEWVARRIRAGNIYVNRNQIGAVVGVQPFGGEGLSGTGPKAGGPHYLDRFTVPASSLMPPHVPAAPEDATRVDTLDPAAFADMAADAAPVWDARADRLVVLDRAVAALPEDWQAAALGVLDGVRPALGPAEPLPGPTGESNHLTLHGRGLALCLGGGAEPVGALLTQALMALAAGNAVAVPAGEGGARLAAALRKGGVPAGVIAAVAIDDPAETAGTMPRLGLVALEGEGGEVGGVRAALAAREGVRVAFVSLSEGVERFATERVVSIDTTASGGNATLLTLPDA
ncbi:bifunctional proline dehydrogenase/L-glutamate gamma-semialdehyde dehydrogenase PutA [Futiania mangrovi]|uniref:Bifunctional protein PutA n=1 Tax=Futiania mangrovi TaxID=2959716 RepID=A0A9J6PDE1_9PROT|nr:bifunctional proline dehydrogenase/L-glutamate gamma-semialdehyde dehydrogenase PutA [Futiania mangrovii]MCP1336366.1 bifunctional proline dehydrogenase/L-glutamate gamma-semialdehyde dehydrogenase PutA [Futiania mangrovii]